ncbi:DUF2125 domain-containing protein [Glacieibacterium frigidum]|uniref:DUF2125 domain-containing protein n=1 Tax=Glacieibacterium frigidum TaxID=2593303 RepID=A0A552UIZ7_9SPHN|nr:DUF2125 domain-containing protein [Glacieibacterium frigidum]TRW18187.1 DUF2125 domain-containing protein [Glacieibacterium frigidum]
MKRFPLWLTLVPLVAGVGGYYWYWSGQRDAFRAEIARVLPGSSLSVGGFPYRLEAVVGSPARKSLAPDIDARVSAAQAVLNRGPFQSDLTVLRSTDPRIVARIPALAEAGVSIAARSAQTSLHLDKKGVVARLSTVLDAARVDAALLGGSVLAKTLEVHFREIPGRLPEAWSATLPERAQVVLAGEGVQMGKGAPLRLAGDLRVTGPTRLVDYARWAGKGTVEVRGLTLGDATGQVLRLDATLVAAAGRPRVTGTILTTCPLSVQAALADGRVSEQRLRIPVKLAFGGSPGAWTLTGMPTPGRPVRGQQPPCPALR